MKSEPLSPTLDGYVEQAGDQADFDDNLVRVRVTLKQRDVSSYTQNQIYLMEFNRLFGACQLLQASSGPKGPKLLQAALSALLTNTLSYNFFLYYFQLRCKLSINIHTPTFIPNVPGGWL